MRRLLLAVALLAVPLAARAQATGVRATKHNLAASAGNSVRAATETEVCVTCHTPHGSTRDGPLWNRSSSSASYVPYTSPSLQASTGVPTGYSKLCLSCHDGTIAIGNVINAPNAGDRGQIAMLGTGPGGEMPAGRTRIGTVLTNDHPISMVFDDALKSDDGELADPALLTGSVRLYEGATAGVRNTVQCTSCHDPHTSALEKFLRKSQRGRTDNLCITCHTKLGWSGSTHEGSSLTAAIDGKTLAVSDHACMSCHAPHTADGAERLVRGGAAAGKSAIEQACYQCHQANGPAQNIQAEIAKVGSRHPVDDPATAGRHRPVFIQTPAAGLPENVQLNPGSPAPDSRFTDAQHVECVDCHNPHQARAANVLQGMRGVDLNGATVLSPSNEPKPGIASQQYTVCLRCHGNSYQTALPPTYAASGLTPTNKQKEFATTNSAFHPVAGPGRNRSPNLQAQLAGAGLGIDSTLKCTDCHNSEDYSSRGKVVKAAGIPSGPHGSDHRTLLRATYENRIGRASYNRADFGLCWLCHDDAQLFGSGTNFTDSGQNFDKRGNLHLLHLRDRIDKTGAVCKSCHFNIHSNAETGTTQYNVDGVVSQTPPTGTPTRLVNFHPNIRGIGGRPRPEWWFNTSSRERRCYLQCHTSSGQPGGVIMGGETGDGGKRAQYRPASGDLP